MTSSFSFTILTKARAIQLHLEKKKKNTNKLFTNQLNILQDLASHFQRTQPNFD